MKNLSIKWKIFLYLFGFCFILLVLLWLFQVVFLESFYKKIKMDEIYNSVSTIESNIDNTEMDNMIWDVGYNNQVCLSIVNASGDVVYANDVIKNCLLHQMKKQDFQSIISNVSLNDGTFLQEANLFEPINRQNLSDQASRARLGERGNGEGILFAKMITNKNNETYYVVANSVISPVNATVNTLRIQLYYITGVMILFAIILALFIAKRVSKPIENINNSAKMLAKGNYDIIFTGSGYKEIEELSNTLNTTATELSKVENLRKELIANVSHDLRTPITLIGGYAEAMRDLPSENNSQNAQIIIDETQRLTTLVNDMLDFSKYQSGAQGLDMVKFNLTSSLLEVVNRISQLLKNEGFNIDFQKQEDVWVCGDETKLVQAFYNLLINAINYTGEDKLVIIKQTVLLHTVKIEVIDSGNGISYEDLPHIWERYYKCDKNHKRAVTGSGIGLSIVKSIIELHGGDYAVDTTINEGSNFWFTLKTLEDNNEQEK